MEIEGYFEGFRRFLEEEKGYSPLTTRSYRSDVRELTRFMRSTDVAPEITNVSRELLRSFISYLRRNGAGDSTVARRLHGLRSFWRYLVDSDLVSDNPCSKVATPRYQRKLPSYLMAEETERLLEAAYKNPDVAMAFRDRATLILLVYAGLRRGELLNLRLMTSA